MCLGLFINVIYFGEDKTGVSKLTSWIKLKILISIDPLKLDGLKTIPLTTARIVNKHKINV